MCLSQINKKYGWNDNIRVGYKVYKWQGYCYFNMYREETNMHMIGDVLKSTDGVIQSDWTGNYEAGFHIYENYKDALQDVWSDNYKIVEVIAWDIRVDGDQSGPCFVAKNMQLIRRIYYPKQAYLDGKEGC